jgi:hypothetical protein
MSYDFAAATSSIKGAVTLLASWPYTLAAFAKYTTHPATSSKIALFGRELTLQENHININCRSTDDQFGFEGWSTASGSSSSYQAGAAEYDGVWVPIVGVFTSSTAYQVFVGAVANAGNIQTNSNSRTNLDSFIIGARPDDTQPFTGKIAEVALWKSVLTSQQITDYMAGNVATGIDATNLHCYYPLNTNRDTETTILNEGTAATGTLDIANAVYAADHPTMIGGSSGSPNYYYAQQGY